MTAKERQDYHKDFEDFRRTRRSSLALSEVQSLCRSYKDVRTELSEATITRVITASDTNDDDRWNVDEAAEVLHRLLMEMRRLRALRRLDPQPERPIQTIVTRNMIYNGYRMNRGQYIIKVVPPSDSAKRREMRATSAHPGRYTLPDWSASLRPEAWGRDRRDSAFERGASHERKPDFNAGYRSSRAASCDARMDVGHE
jgi:hypothetical protein